MVRHQHGVTLVEVVVAMGLVFTALLALSGLAAISVQGAASAKHLTTATFLAQEQLEDAKRTGYDPNIVGAVEVVEPYGSLPMFPLYKRVLTIDPNTPVGGMQMLTVEVSWADDRHAVSLSTILAE